MNRKKILILIAVIVIGLVVFLLLPRTGNTGQLSLQINPSDANIAIDGEIQGDTKLRLEPGTHLVYITKQGYFSHSKNVVITKGETTDLSVQLVKKTDASTVETIFRKSIYANYPDKELKVLATKKIYGGFWLIGGIETGEEPAIAILQKDDSDDGYKLYLSGPPFNRTTLAKLPDEIQALVKDDSWLDEGVK